MTGYDVFDRRIEKLVDTTSPFDMVDAVIERYVYDDASGVASLAGGNVVLDFVDPDGDGQAPMELTARQLYGAAIDQILAKEDLAESLSDPERVLWHLADHLGTTRDLVDHEGVLVEHYEYDSFGNVVAGDTSLTRYLFTGREWDADVELQYSRARWYDPSVGRWISEDPIGFAGGDVNLARYVGNSPVSRSDPSGLEEAHLPYSADPMDTVSNIVLPEDVNYPPNPYSTDGTWWAFTGGFIRGFFSRENASTAVGSIPLVGTAQSGVEVVTGYDYIGRTPVDRRVAAAGIILGMAPGGKTAAKTGAKVGNKVLGNSAGATARLVDNVPIRGSLPGSSRLWGKNRFVKEIHDLIFVSWC